MPIVSVETGNMQITNRIVNALDVSASFDNCFFHSFALYLLANQQSFPVDLFSIHPDDNKLIKELKNIFKNMDDLELFDIYAKLKTSNVQSSLQLVEKTMVLGVLLRSLFTHKLLLDEVNCKRLWASESQGHTATFKSLIQSANELGEFTDKVLAEEAIYAANKQFFQGMLSVKLTDNDEELEKYWLEQGYPNYCKYLAEPGVKITFSDINPVLDSLAIPFTLYNKGNSSIITQGATPIQRAEKFELALDAQSSHYFLMQTNATESFLKQYAESYAQYKKERESVLENVGYDKLSLCKSKSSMLLASILSPDFLQGKTPLAVLVDSISELKRFVERPAVNIQHAVSQNILNPAIKFAKQGATDLHALPTEVNTIKTHVKSMTATEIKLRSQLQYLHEKVRYFAKQSKANKETPDGKYNRAKIEASQLHSLLKMAFDNYLKSLKTPEEYNAFKDECITAIKASKKRGILQEHRGLKEILGNIALAVLGVGVFYAIAGAIHYAKTGRFLFFSATDTGNQVDAIEESIKSFEHESFSVPLEVL